MDNENFDIDFGEVIRIEGGGAVDSVNGKTGDVVLTTSDLENTSDYQTGDEVSEKIDRAINLEIAARENADTVLSNRIDAEATARQNADSAINGRLSTIEGEIPAQASSSNQLADKDFVNSSVATNTANFVGTFNSLAELEAVQNPSNNDYGFVVATDAQGNTVYNRYKYVAEDSEWLFEYALNNSSFTANQWAAINSGIESGDVSKLAGLANIKTIGANLNLNANGELSGDYSNFTGATSSTNGVQGLVPAPAAGDEDKYLKGDGTWEDVQAGPTVVQTTGSSTTDVMSQKAVTDALSNLPSDGVIELTAEDYDYPDDNPTGVALWRLDGGLYKTSGNVNCFLTTITTTTPNSGGTILILKAPSSNPNYVRTFIMLQNSNSSNLPEPYLVSNLGSDVLDGNKWATLSNIYADPSSKRIIRLGYNAQAFLANSIALGSGANTFLGDTVAIGSGASAYSGDGIAIGRGSEAGSSQYDALQSIAIGGQTKARAYGAIALGQGAIASNTGEMNIGAAGDVQFGYNNSNYRLLSGVYDGQAAHDAVNVEQVNSVIDAINTALSTNIPHIGASQ